MIRERKSRYSTKFVEQFFYPVYTQEIEISPLFYVLTLSSVRTNSKEETKNCLHHGELNFVVCNFAETCTIITRGVVNV